MPSKHILIFLTFILISRINAQGYGDAPDPEPVTVTSAPLVIDCGPPGAPQTLPTLPPIQFPTLPPAPKMPTFEEIFTTAGYPTGPVQKQEYGQAPPELPTLPPLPKLPTIEFTTVAPQQQGYDQAPPQLPTLPPPPKIPTFNELFPPAPITKFDPYAQPKIEYVPVAAATPASYPTAPPAFTFPPPMKLPTLAELFPPAPAPPALIPPKPVGGYDVGPPAVQPQEPYSNDENEDMDGDDVLLQPVEGDSAVNGKSKAILNPEKARAKLEKLRRMMHGVKTIKLGTAHHLHMHNFHEKHYNVH